jgi:sugar transferase (PEP-CTERM/EpsH1 system associated)
MKILFLAFELPYPLDRGGRVKTFHFLQALARHHKVTLVALSRSPLESQHLGRFAGWLEAVHLVPVGLSWARKMRLASLGLWRRKPFVMALYDSREMRDLVSTLLQTQEYDVIYADHLHMSQYVPKSTGSFTVLDQHNVEAVILHRFFQSRRLGPLKAFAWWEWRRMASYEPAECRRFNMVLVTTPIDAELVRPWLQPEQRLEVLPIGVDVEYFKPVSCPSDSCTLVSLGTLAWQPNADGVLWFCREVLPLVQAHVPGVTFQIIGDRPPVMIRKLGEDKAIELLGRVDDVRPFLTNSAGLIVPLRVGSGMRVKVLDALAMGVPVVSTTVGCEGIAVTHGRDVLIADRPPDFARAIVELMSDGELQRRLSKAGRALVTERYAWPVIHDQIGKVFADILGRRAEVQKPC